MTIQQLEYVLALDKYRHFVKAAKECFVTQPTITIQVQKLEDEMGLQIFDRSKSPITPTSIGEVIIAKAQSIVYEVKHLKELVNNERDSIVGEFKIGVIPTVSPYIVPKFIGNFMSIYPDTLLSIDEMQTEAIVEGLNTGEIDIGILVTPVGESFIRELPLYNEPFLYYGGEDSPYKSRKSVSSKDVERQEGLWLLNSGHCFRNQVLNICNQSKSKKRIIFQSGSIETLKKMVDNCGGFTLIPEMSLTEKDSLHAIHFDSPKPAREVSLVVHKSFVKEALLEVLRKEILNVIPSSLAKNKRIMKVRWR